MTQMREKILDATFVAMEQRGYAGASLAAIGAACGLRKQSLYTHFASKEALARSVLERSKERFRREQLGALRDPDTHPVGALHAHLERVLPSPEEPEPEHSLFAVLAAELAGNGAVLREPLQEVYREWALDLARALERAIAEGALSAHLDPMNLAYFLIAAIEGGQILARALGPESCQRVRQALDHVLESWSPGPEFLRS